MSLAAFCVWARIIALELILITLYEVLLLRTVYLNQVGPGWEVPVDVVMQLAWLRILSILCIFLIILFIWFLREQIIKTDKINKFLLIVHAFILLSSTIFVFYVQAFDGQFYYPEFISPIAIISSIFIIVLLFCVTIFNICKDS